MKNLTLIAILIISIIVLKFFYEQDYAITNNVPKGETIVSFGDSLTFGTGASKGMDYPAQLSVLIDETIINKGKPGDTTLTALSRLDTVLEHNPRIVLITLGGNDLKNGVKKKQAFKNLKVIIQRIQNSGALVILGGIDIPFFGRGFVDAYEELAIETGSVLIPNILKDVMGNPKLMSDRIHPNDEGYAVMTQYFYSAIKSYL